MHGTSHTKPLPFAIAPITADLVRMGETPRRQAARESCLNNESFMARANFYKGRVQTRRRTARMQAFIHFNREHFHTSSMRPPLAESGSRTSEQCWRRSIRRGRCNTTESISERGGPSSCATNHFVDVLEMIPSGRSNANYVNRLRR